MRPRPAPPGRWTAGPGRGRSGHAKGWQQTWGLGAGLGSRHSHQTLSDWQQNSDIVPAIQVVDPWHQMVRKSTSRGNRKTPEKEHYDGRLWHRGVPAYLDHGVYLPDHKDYCTVGRSASQETLCIWAHTEHPRRCKARDHFRETLELEVSISSVSQAAVS